MANYGKELRMGGDIKRKGKVESVTAFVERMKKVHEEAEAALRKTQEEMKRYADRGRKETEKWEKGDCYDRCLLESTWTWVKGMMTTIGCAGVVSVSASCGRHCNLT